MKLKAKFILPIVSMMILLSSCSFNLVESIYDNDEKIASETNTFNLGEIEQEISDNMIEAQIDNIEGMETIWSFTSEKDIDVELSGEFSVKSGKAKLVLILPDNTLAVIAEKDSTVTDNNEIMQTLSIKKGLNRIKIVAEKNTELELKLSSADGEFQKLGIDW